MKTLSRELVSSLSPTELLIEMARRGITALPEKNILLGSSTCPHCGHTGVIEKDFGIRVMRGEVWPQSWCRGCRSARGKARRMGLLSR